MKWNGMAWHFSIPFYKSTLCFTGLSSIIRNYQHTEREKFKLNNSAKGKSETFKVIEVAVRERLNNNNLTAMTTTTATTKAIDKWICTFTGPMFFYAHHSHSELIHTSLYCTKYRTVSCVCSRQHIEFSYAKVKKTAYRIRHVYGQLIIQ